MKSHFKRSNYGYKEGDFDYHVACNDYKLHFLAYCLWYTRDTRLKVENAKLDMSSATMNIQKENRF